MIEKIDKIRDLLIIPNVGEQPELALNQMKILNLLVELRTEAEQLTITGASYNMTGDGMNCLEFFDKIQMKKEQNLNNSTEQVLTTPVVSERFFACDCKGEGLLMTKNEEDKSIYFSLYGYGVGYKPKPSLWDRIKYAWYHIKTGKKYADCIIMDYQKANEVRDWLDLNAR